MSWDIHDGAFARSGRAVEIADQIQRGGAAGQHEAGDFRRQCARGMPCMGTHAYALTRWNAEGRSRGQVHTAVCMAAGHHLDDAARERGDDLLRQQVLFEAGDEAIRVSVVDPENFRSILCAGLEAVLVPEIGSRVGESRRALLRRISASEHPAKRRERLGGECLNRQCALANGLWHGVFPGRWKGKKKAPRKALVL